MASSSLIVFHFAFYFVSAPSLGFVKLKVHEWASDKHISGDSKKDSRSERFCESGDGNGDGGEIDGDGLEEGLQFWNRGEGPLRPQRGLQAG